MTTLIECLDKDFEKRVIGYSNEQPLELFARLVPYYQVVSVMDADLFDNYGLIISEEDPPRFFGSRGNESLKLVPTDRGRVLENYIADVKRDNAITKEEFLEQLGNLESYKKIMLQFESPEKEVYLEILDAQIKT